MEGSNRAQCRIECQVGVGVEANDSCATGKLCSPTDEIALATRIKLLESYSFFQTRRKVGINCPEPGECFAVYIIEAVRHSTSNLLPGQ